MSLLKTSVSKQSPTDGSSAQGTDPPQVSDFLTIQSLTNFGAMTGAITAAWNALIVLNAELFGAKWVPFAFAGAFAVVSLLISLDGLKDDGGKFNLGTVVATIFIGLINALILASAVIGASSAVGASAASTP